MPQRNIRVFLPAALAVAILAVSTASILIRFAQRDAASLTIAALRLTLASLFITPVALLRHRPQLKGMRTPELLLCALSGLFLAVHFATWISSLEYTSVASSVVLVSTGPLWVALVAPFALREHLSRATVLGLGLAILGGTVIGADNACTWSAGLQCSGFAEVLHGRAMWGNFLALAGAWAVSGYLIIGRRVRPTLHLVPYIWLSYGFAAIALLAGMAIAGQDPFHLRPLTYLWVLLLALVPQLIGHSTYNWALGFLPAALVATMTLGEPIGSAILAYIVLSERPGWPVLTGGVLVLAGIYLAARNSQVNPGRSS
jgi:drug/metabolite transporter (DMT)-like permease